MSSNPLIDQYNAKNLVFNVKQEPRAMVMPDSTTGGKMLKLHNLLTDNNLGYLYPPLEYRNISVEGLVMLSQSYDFVQVMKKLCKIKQRDAVKLMSVIIKFISTEYAAGRTIDQDQDIVRMMENRSKKRLPRYEEDDEIYKRKQDPKEKSVIVNKADFNPNLFKQPGYNPFEMKFRNVNEYPLPQSDQFDKENMLNQYINVVKAEPGVKAPGLGNSGMGLSVTSEISRLNQMPSSGRIYEKEIKIGKRDTAIKTEPGIFDEELGIKTTKVQSSFKMNSAQSVYPTLINLAYPFVITKLSMEQIRIKAKLKQERQNILGHVNCNYGRSVYATPMYY